MQKLSDYLSNGVGAIAMTTIAQHSYDGEIASAFSNLGYEEPCISDSSVAFSAALSSIDGESWVSGSMECVTVKVKRKVSLDYIDARIVNDNDETILTVSYDRVLSMVTYGTGEGELYQSVRESFSELYRDLIDKVTFNQLKSAMSKVRTTCGSLQINRNVWYIPADSAISYAELTDELSSYGITTVLVPLLPVREHIEPVVEVYSKEIHELLEEINNKLRKILRDGNMAPRAIDAAINKFNHISRLIEVASTMTDETFDTSEVERKLNKIKG